MPVGRRETFQILAMNAQHSRKFWMKRAREALTNIDDCEELESCLRCAYDAHQEVLKVKRIARDYGVPI